MAVGIVFIFTGVRKFASLGECWRYISFNLYFLGPIALNEAANLLGVSGSVKVAVAASLVVYYCMVFRFSKKETNGNRLLLDLLNRQAGELRDSVWFAVPYRLSTIAVVKGFGRQTFEFQYGKIDQATMTAYFARYPYLHSSKEFMRTHGVTHLLVDKAALLNLDEHCAVNVKDRDFELVDENGDFAIYRFGRSSDAALHGHASAPEAAALA
jgi:hypothetical protein